MVTSELRCRRRETCRLCASAALELALPLEATPPADHYVTRDALGEVQEAFPLEVLLCRHCGHAQLSVVVDPNVLYGSYIYETSTSPGLAEHFGRYAASMLQRHSYAPGSLVIDVGSNDGLLLRSFAARGMSVLGIEPAKRIAANATAAGIPTLAAFLDQHVASRVRAEYGPASVVTANNVFANVDDLDEFTAAIRLLLAPNGIFVIETSYFVDLVHNMVWDSIYHEHLSYFTVDPLARFFRKHGMLLVAAERVPTKGGSIRLTVAAAMAGADQTPSVAAMTAEEAAEGIGRPERLVAFKASIDERRAQLLKVLNERLRRGRTIDCYGASNTTTTLLYYYGVGGMIRHLVDDNPIKQGRFSPGLHLPVVSASTAFERPPDDVLVAAWRFADAIVSRHERTQGSGKFIVPLPDVTVR